MKLIQCDDLVEPAVADEVERLMVSGGFPWFFYPNVNNSLRPEEQRKLLTEIHDDSRFADSFGFSHLLFPTEQPNSPLFLHPKRLFEAFLNKHRLLPTKLLRVKANLLVRAAVSRPFTPHVDLPFPHWVMIYYVNDSDGDTLILDKTYPDRDNAQVVHAISPKKGRAILFDGRYYHCGTSPVDHDTRIVFNYDFT